MEWFNKAFQIVMNAGFAVLGVLCGLIVLRVALSVAGALLGSVFGTILLIVIVWSFAKGFHDSSKKDEEF